MQSSWCTMKALLRTVMTRRFVVGYVYTFLRSHCRVRANHVLLESHHGKDFGGNPYYLAAWLASDPQYRHLRLIMVGPPHRKQWLRQRLCAPNITVVKPRSIRYAFHLATSKWLISDVTFPLYFSRRSEQKYLNTWHGTPLKVLGRDIPGGTIDQLQNSQRNFLHATWILAPNHHTEKVLLEAYCLRGFCEGRMLRLGYPRNDPLRRSLSREDLSTEAHIAFMPTWRGGLSSRKSDSQQQLTELADLLDHLDRLLPSSVILWVKLHPLVSGRITLDHCRLIKPFPQDVETYEHLATCDALITDYSSVLFDFAATRRPIFRYIPDEDYYEAERGFCLDPSMLPFPCARTPVALVALVQELLDRMVVTPDEQYTRFLKTFNSLDRGTSAQDVCRAFFTEDMPDGVCGLQAAKTTRHVALYFGSQALVLSPDAYMPLLARLDTSRYSFVLLVEADAVTQEWEAFLRGLDSAFLYLTIQLHAYIAPLEFLGLAWERAVHRRDDDRGGTWCEVGIREYRRLFGDTDLDILISLDGESTGSRLLDNGHTWYSSVRLSPRDVVNKKPEDLECLQEYCWR